MTREHLAQLRELAYRATSGRRRVDFTGCVQIGEQSIVWGSDDDVRWLRDADGELCAALDVETVLELLSLAERALSAPEPPVSLPRVEPG
jgi:hypothetical protein